MLYALSIVAVETAAAVGFGAMTLSALGLREWNSAAGRLVLSFSIGVGVIGWLMFFVAASGWLSVGPAVVLVGGLPGLLLIRGPLRPTTDPWSAWDLLLAGILGGWLCVELAAGMAPPSDADSLAYHFALPKLFLAEERLVFVARAVDAASPFLTQMTYLPALSIGGERALTLWAVISSWAAPGLLYCFSRRWLPRVWALALTLALLTTPAMLYGGTSGQVEPRLAAYAFIAALAVAEARVGGGWRHAALAGLASGFFAGSKFTGLLFGACCGLLLLQRRGFASVLAFSLAALFAAFQWYGWLWWNTGDPVFPMLYGYLGSPGNAFWNEALQADLRSEWSSVETPLARTLIGLLTYPFLSTWGGGGIPDADRVGLGALPLLLLPLAAAHGLWRASRPLDRRLLVVAAIVSIFYVAWFFAGVSQRPRHLLPILPLILLCLGVATHHFVTSAGTCMPVAAGVAVVLFIQLAGASLYMRVFLPYIAGRESRDEFLLRTVSGYDAARWINAHLPISAKVVTNERQLPYLLDTRHFLLHQWQAVVDYRYGSGDPPRFLADLRRIGATHVLINGPLERPLRRNILENLRALDDAGCLRRVADIPTRVLASRTLGEHVATQPAILFALAPAPCAIEAR